MRNNLISLNIMNILYIISTPIGNLSDLTFRAKEILENLSVVFCEDTRVTKKLLDHYNIKNTKLISLNARTEDKKTKELLNFLQNGADVGYVSDAGTPGISDPGQKLVRAVKEAGFQVVPIPGVSAVSATVSVSGMHANHWTFYGFLPQKKGRQTLLKEIANLKHPAVLYESKHRILKLLKELVEYMPNKKVIIARELTKMHEEFLQGAPQELLAILEQNPQKQKGEFVVVVY